MKNSGIMKFTTSLIYILFGLALMIWPQKVENVICALLAACVIIFGIAKILGYAVIKVETRIAEDTNGFAIGVSLIILGIFLWLKGTMIIALIPFILGFMITYKGLEGIQNVINFKKFGYGTSKGVLIAIRCHCIIRNHRYDEPVFDRKGIILHARPWTFHKRSFGFHFGCFLHKTAQET